VNRVVILGEPGRVGGFRLAGATIIEAAGPEEVERAWGALPTDTTLLVLTPRAAEIVGVRLPERMRLTWVVMPG
jgi:vacuolar-type H+-ATPase subunit F/Vma7